MFRFKQFIIRQDRCPMKVGTDGVLVGAWAGVEPSDRQILDIGTGTGLIALMMAQRAPAARIVGVDVEEISQARENADASPWGGRVAFKRSRVQELPVPEEPFDLIVSNPPFFVDSLTCPDQGRTTARHAVQLPFNELRDSVVRMLSRRGRFAVILPVEQALHFIRICEGQLTLTRRTDVRTTPRHAAKRVLMEFVLSDAGTGLMPGTVFSGSASDAVPVVSELIVGTGEHEQYTPEYRALTRDFYLKF